MASTTPATHGPAPVVGNAAVKTDSSKSAEEAQNSGRPKRLAASGRATESSAPASDQFQMRFSLAEIANATGLREDDVAFTMLHTGLARFRTPATSPMQTEEGAIVIPDEDVDMEVVVSPSLVEEVATRLRVKPPVLSRAHFLV